jgi:predicted AlkP superfamily pyrophosphatase or phosphodiesterase
VNQVIDWLRLPEAERPTFITLYFSEVDTIGHRNGPESREVLESAASLDAEVAALVAGVRELGLDSRVHYVVVSDHGMSQLSNTKIVTLDDYLDMSQVQTIDGSPVMGLSPRAGSALTDEAIVAALSGKHPALAAYTRAETPGAPSLPETPPHPARDCDGG